MTDSGCDIPPALLQRFAISVVPHVVKVGERVFLDRVNITPDQFYRRQVSTRQAISVLGPAPVDFQNAYGNLSRATNEILSIHTSAKLSGSYASALAAKNAISNPARVEIIDSRSASMGLGFLVLAAGMAAQRNERLDAITALVRGMVLQTHVVFALEQTEYLDRTPQFARLRAAIGDVSDSRALLHLEDGTLELAEKVRTRTKAIERLYEFAELFPHIEDMAVLYGTNPIDADSLVKRIDTVFSKEQVVVTQYGPTLGVFLGPGAMGVAAYEGRG
ncbi:MAG: DegV family protein [Chloroflexota bacterium]